jgi:hypothetical protein
MYVVSFDTKGRCRKDSLIPFASVDDVLPAQECFGRTDVVLVEIDHPKCQPELGSK